MIWNLLAEEGAEQAPTGGSNWVFYVLIAILLVLVVVWLVLSGRKNKRATKEYEEQLAAIRPGHKVKSMGGLCGIVVEVCDDNTVIIETGSETTGKSYFKLDKESIYQTDAKGPTQIAREEAEARRRAEKQAKAAGKDDEVRSVEASSEEEKPEDEDK